MRGMLRGDGKYFYIGGQLNPKKDSLIYLKTQTTTSHTEWVLLIAIKSTAFLYGKINIQFSTRLKFHADNSVHHVKF